MPTCSACGTVYDDPRGGCPVCQGADDLTRLRETVSRPASASAQTTASSSSGWLTSAAIDHGRFTPGTLLGARYRIVERLGTGGMGEVYRADDLKVGQTVALKFLPASVDRDPARLTQFHTEVRLARQVSHPNVCTVYDIDEADGHTFLSMEYVDGENLASLLRRIGRFPQDRALEIARQICAGVAAAHERGVVHRDLKPANVMIDGEGHVRVTDFGLAGASGEVLRAGTPAYMAPEQLAGGEVTARSDIYALGLVLYEIFTGRRALEGRTVAELIRQREQMDIRPPTSLVPDLDPRIERAIMRCLHPEAKTRPASALRVSASLPGGDPLAAALAAGETPSPAMVAAAGQTDAVRARYAGIAAAWIALGLVLITLAYQRVQLANVASLAKPPAALADRAAEATARLGYPLPARDTAAGFAVSTDYMTWVMAQPSRPAHWTALGTMHPEPYTFWLRTSPRLLVPTGGVASVDALNPPLALSGMTLAVVDDAGRLSEFHAIPEAVESREPHGPTDWSVPLRLAGFDPARLERTAPSWIPLVYADERAAWQGVLPDRPDLPVRLEAAAYHGRIVFFGVIGAWTHSVRETPRAAGLGHAGADGPRFLPSLTAVSQLTIFVIMIAGASLARRNLRGGRGDRVAAFRAAGAIFFIAMIAWALRATHVPDIASEIDRFFLAAGAALFEAAVLWVMYVGLEPYVRRAAPQSLIGWTRLVSGKWRDPHVGVDVLAGVSAGLLMTLLYAGYYLLPAIAGRPDPMPAMTDLEMLQGTRFVLASLADRISSGVTSGMVATLSIVAITLLVRRRVPGAIVSTIVFTPIVLNGLFSPGYPMLGVGMAMIIFAVLAAVTVRFGLLSAIATLTVHFLLLRTPLTTQLGSWRGPASLWILGSVTAIGLAGLVAARSGERAGTAADFAEAHAAL